jgi:hypothetical protein
MPRRRPVFPFAPLPADEIHVPASQGDPRAEVDRDTKIVRWFVEVLGERNFKACPLADMLSAYEAADQTAPTKPIENIEPARAQFLLHFAAHFARLAWAITALCAFDSLEHVDGSFFADDLLGADNRQRDAEQKLPGGIGTLYLCAIAARHRCPAEPGIPALAAAGAAATAPKPSAFGTLKISVRACHVPWAYAPQASGDAFLLEQAPPCRGAPSLVTLPRALAQGFRPPS